MLAFMTFTPYHEAEVFLEKAQQVCSQLKWKYEQPQGNKLIVHLPLSFKSLPGTLTIEYISAKFVNLTIEIPMQAADSGKSGEFFKQFVEAYQQLI